MTTEKQIRKLLRLVNDRDRSFQRFSTGPIRVWRDSEIISEPADISLRTVDAVIRSGFVKNVGSLRYKHYTISPSGQRHLLKLNALAAQGEK